MSTKSCATSDLCHIGESTEGSCTGFVSALGVPLDSQCVAKTATENVIVASGIRFNNQDHTAFFGVPLCPNTCQNCTYSSVRISNFKLRVLSDSPSKLWICMCVCTCVCVYYGKRKKNVKIEKKMKCMCVWMGVKVNWCSLLLTFNNAQKPYFFITPSSRLQQLSQTSPSMPHATCR